MMSVYKSIPMHYPALPTFHHLATARCFVSAVKDSTFKHLQEILILIVESLFPPSFDPPTTVRFAACFWRASEISAAMKLIGPAGGSTLRLRKPPNNRRQGVVVSILRPSMLSLDPSMLDPSVFAMPSGSDM